MVLGALGAEGESTCGGVGSIFELAVCGKKFLSGDRGRSVAGETSGDTSWLVSW